MVLLQRTTFAKRNTNCVQHLLLQFKNCESNCDQDNILTNDQLTPTERNILAAILLDICKDCVNMASLPQGAFAACKLRENRMDQDLTISRMKSWIDKNDKNSFGNKKLMEYSPVKYNGKLMNSIWGLYNRYSPHNIKGNEYESKTQAYFLQQPTAVASFAIAQNMTVAMKPGSEWCFEEK